MSNETIIDQKIARKIMSYFYDANQNISSNIERFYILFDRDHINLFVPKEDQRVEHYKDMIRIYSKSDLLRFFEDRVLVASDNVEIPSDTWYKHLLIEDDSVSVFYTKTKNLTVING